MVHVRHDSAFLGRPELAYEDGGNGVEAATNLSTRGSIDCIIQLNRHTRLFSSLLASFASPPITTLLR